MLFEHSDIQPTVENSEVDVLKENPKILVFLGYIYLKLIYFQTTLKKKKTRTTKKCACKPKSLRIRMVLFFRAGTCHGG